MKLVIYAKVRNAAKKEGDPISFMGVKLDMGDIPQEIPYDELVAAIDKAAFLKQIVMDGIVSSEDVTFITEKEYINEFDRCCSNCDWYSEFLSVCRCGSAEDCTEIVDEDHCCEHWEEKDDGATD